MSKIVILVVAANPDGIGALNCNEEVRAIGEGLYGGRLRDLFASLEFCPQASAQDLITCITRYRPHVVHFSGHGSEQNELLFAESIVVEERQGLTTMRRRENVKQAIPPTTMAEIFRLGAPNLQLVVLNACFSDLQAAAIAQHVDCVVGISGKTHNRYAVEFARGIYRALADNLVLGEAFEAAKTLLSIPLAVSIPISPPEVLLKTKAGVNPNAIRLVHRMAAGFGAGSSLAFPGPETILSFQQPIRFTQNLRVEIFTQKKDVISLPWDLPSSFTPLCGVVQFEEGLEGYRQFDFLIRRLYVAVRDIHLSLFLDLFNANSHFSVAGDHMKHAQEVLNAADGLASALVDWCRPAIDSHAKNLSGDPSLDIIYRLPLCIRITKFCLSRVALQPAAIALTARLSHWLVSAHVACRQAFEQLERENRNEQRPSKS